jgi:GTPase SAR1 family protein
MEMYQKVKENKYILKMVVLGDVGVGKTNIIRRILKQEYNKQEETVGVEFAFIDITDIDPDNPDIKLTIQIWDTCNYIFYFIIFIFSWS